MEGRTEGPSVGRVRLDRLSAADRSRFAAEIRPLRRAAGLTQEELAAAAGVDRRTIGNLERGVFVPQIDVLRRVLRALGVPTEEDDVEPETAQWLAVVAALIEHVPHERRDALMREIVGVLASAVSADRPGADVGGAPDDASMRDLRYAADVGNDAPDEDLRTP